MNRFLLARQFLRCQSIVQVRYARTKSVSTPPPSSKPSKPSTAAVRKIIRKPRVLDDSTPLAAMIDAASASAKKSPRKLKAAAEQEQQQQEPLVNAVIDDNDNVISTDEDGTMFEELYVSPKRDAVPAANRPKPILESEIVAFLKENTKLTDIDVVDLRRKVSWTNGMVFAVGASGRQLSAAAQALSLHVK